MSYLINANISIVTRNKIASYKDALAMSTVLMDYYNGSSAWRNVVYFVYTWCVMKSGDGAEECNRFVYRGLVNKRLILKTENPLPPGNFEYSFKSRDYMCDEGYQISFTIKATPTQTPCEALGPAYRSDLPTRFGSKKLSKLIRGFGNIAEEKRGHIKIIN